MIAPRSLRKRRVRRFGGVDAAFLGIPPDERGRDKMSERIDLGRQRSQRSPRTRAEGPDPALSDTHSAVAVDEVTATALRRFRAALQAACATPNDATIEALRQAAAPVRDRVSAGCLPDGLSRRDAPRQ